jgi:hypothetical protein
MEPLHTYIDRELGKATVNCARDEDEPIPVAVQQRYGNHTSKYVILTAYERWRDDRDSAGTVAIRPYSKKTGRPIIGSRQSRRLVQDLGTPFFSKSCRLISRIPPTDLVISRCLAALLRALLEDEYPDAAGGGPVLSPRCFAYRTTKTGHQAIDELDRAVARDGLVWVARTDVRSYFDRIRHDTVGHQIQDLFQRLGCPDEKVARWIRNLISAPKELRWKTLTTQDGETKRVDIIPTAPAGLFRDGIGIPQGSPLSAPLSNLYLAQVDHDMDRAGEREQFRYLRYADDMCICAATRAGAERGLDLLRRRIQAPELGLELGEEKTSVDHIDSGRVTFLGFHYVNRAQGKQIAKAKVQKHYEKILRVTSRQRREEMAGLGETALAEYIIPQLNVRLERVTRAGADKDREVVSSRSFIRYYKHRGCADLPDDILPTHLVVGQLHRLERFCKRRVLVFATGADNVDCLDQDWHELLERTNAPRHEAGHKPIRLKRPVALYHSQRRNPVTDRYGIMT